MPINVKSTARMDEFLGELEKYGIRAIHSNRSIYQVNDKKVSIRTTTKPPPKFWYDISEGILNRVDYFIYQTDTSQHFALFPSSFFKESYRNLQDSNRPKAKIFYIDWPHRKLESSNVSLNISSYCCSLHPNESPGDLSGIFDGQVDNLEEQVATDPISPELEEQFEEGGKQARLVAFYERDIGLRTKAINIHKTTCKACGFNFSNAYGDWGKDYIEVHHLVPISTYIEPTMVDPERDLTVLCANCHRMIHHKRDKALSLSELIEIVQK